MPKKRKAVKGAKKTIKTKPAIRLVRTNRRVPKRPRVKTTALAIRAPIGVLPPDHLEPPVMPAPGALTLPEQPVITLPGLSLLANALTAKETRGLMADFRTDKINIKPTGEVFISHIHLRVRLSTVLGVGSWGMQPKGKPTPMHDEWIVMPWELKIRGYSLSWTWGGARYRAANKRQSWSDALETTKSNALMRLCKDIPLGGQVWDDRHNDRFKSRHCVLVYVKTKDGTELSWRTKDHSPFRGEAGAHPESPNLDTYTSPEAAPAQSGRTEASGPRLITEKQAKRLLRIAADAGWKKHEVVAFLRDTCKISPAEGKPADQWHLSVAVPMKDYDTIVSDIQHGVE